MRFFYDRVLLLITKDEEKSCNSKIESRILKADIKFGQFEITIKKENNFYKTKISVVGSNVMLLAKNGNINLNEFDLSMLLQCK